MRIVAASALNKRLRRGKSSCGDGTGAADHIRASPCVKLHVVLITRTGYAIRTTGSFDPPHLLTIQGRRFRSFEIGILEVGVVTRGRYCGRSTGSAGVLNADRMVVPQILTDIGDGAHGH